MNLSEIAARQTVMGRHRLRMSAAANVPMGIFADLYRGGSPMLSIMFPATEEGRDFIVNISAVLGPDTISLTHDTFIRSSLPTDALVHYEPGEFARDFESGDTTVREALSISTATNDEAPLQVTIPYTRLPDVRIDLREDNAIDSSMTSGRIDDELTFMLSGVFQPALAAGFLHYAPTFAESLIHVYDGEPWTLITPDPVFESGWTKTTSGWINGVALTLDNQISLVDVTLDDRSQARALRSLAGRNSGLMAGPER